MSWWGKHRHSIAKIGTITGSLIAGALTGGVGFAGSAGVLGMTGAQAGMLAGGLAGAAMGGGQAASMDANWAAEEQANAALRQQEEINRREAGNQQQQIDASVRENAISNLLGKKSALVKASPTLNKAKRFGDA